MSWSLGANANKLTRNLCVNKVVERDDVMAVCLDYQAVYCNKREKASSFRLQIVATSCLLVALLCKVWIKIECTDLGYQVAREMQKTVAMDMERRELELQLSVLLRADNLTAAAQKRLGMGALNPKQARKVQY